MAIAAFAYGFVITLVFSLPADWAWRRGGTVVTAVASLVNVAAIVVVVILAGRLGLYTGAGAVVALVVGIVLAGIAGDAAATALWGRARFRSW
jgi:hypothetical protein